MQIGKPTLELLVLSQSRDLTVRRLRGFAASIGASARLFHSLADLKCFLDEKNQTLRAPLPHVNLERLVILWDRASLPVPAPSAFEMQEALAQIAAFIVTGEELPASTRIKSEKAPESLVAATWTKSNVNLYLGWPLSRLIDTQVARVALVQALTLDQNVNSSTLMRWGHVSAQWTNTVGEQSVLRPKTHSLLTVASTFAAQMGLRAMARTHLLSAARFFEKRSPHLALLAEQVNFATDGILTSVTAVCEAADETVLSAWAKALQGCGCHAVILSQESDKRWQVAAVYANQAYQTVAEKVPDVLGMAEKTVPWSPLIIVIRKTDEDAAFATKDLSVAS